MALGSTQPVTEMTTRNLPGSQGRPTLKAPVTGITSPLFIQSDSKLLSGVLFIGHGNPDNNLESLCI
jgi:hypothetical protein